MGFEGSLGWSPTEALTLYGSVAYLDGELQDNYVYNSAGAELQTKGKKLVETPDWTASFRASYTFSEMFSGGVQAKYTGERWITDVNDLADDAFTIVDLDARIDFTPWGYEDTYLQINVTNVFDEDYYAGLGTRASATPGQLGYSRPFATTGAPRTWMATLRVGF